MQNVHSIGRLMPHLVKWVGRHASEKVTLQLVKSKYSSISEE